MKHSLKKFIKAREYFKDLVQEMATLTYKINASRNLCSAKTFSKAEKAKRIKARDAMIKRKEDVRAEITAINKAKVQFKTRYLAHLIDCDGQPQEFKVYASVATAAKTRNTVARKLDSQGRLSRCDIDIRAAGSPLCAPRQFVVTENKKFRLCKSKQDK